MRNFIIGLICSLVGCTVGAGIAYHILKETYELRIKEYKKEIRQKENLTKIHVYEYYKLSNVLEKCKRCQTKYYDYE